MESRFAHDFSRVRIHTDARAAESARAVEATAYTVGQHVVFGAGRYEPSTPAGQRLLAHELTHTLQQAHAGPFPLQTSSLSIGEAGDAAEREAEAVASRLTGDRPVTVNISTLTSPRPTLRRQRGNEPAGGCGVCMSPAATGTMAHFIAEQLFKASDPDIEREAKFVFPGDAENARLDLLRIIRNPIPPTLVEIGEIKPDNDKGREAGKRDLAFYHREVAAAFPGPMFAVGFLTVPPPPASVPFVDPTGLSCPAQELTIRGSRLGGQEGLYFYSCTPPRSRLPKTCCGPPPVPVRARQPADEREREPRRRGEAPQPVPVPVPVPGKTPQPVPVPVPATRSPLEQVADFVRDLLKAGLRAGEEAERAIREFLERHPELVDTIIFAAVAGIVATILEDIATAGVGIADDPVIIALCVQVIRIARAIRAGTAVLRTVPP